MGFGIKGRGRVESNLASLTRFLPMMLGVACSANVGEQGGEVTVALTCEGVCPLHVDPGAAQEGDGASWETPMRSVRAAIDAQGAQGGGEVWVRAGGPFVNLTGDPNVTLLELRPNVGLFGGFTGTETSKDERDPSSRTVIAGAPHGTASENVPLIVGAAETTLDGFSIVGQHGPAFVLRAATGARVANVSIEDSYVNRMGLIDLLDSDAQFDGVSVTDSTTVQGVPGILATGSTVRVSDSEFARLGAQNGGSAGILASSSTLVLEGVRFEGNNTRAAGKSAGFHATASDVLVIDSVWLDNMGDRGSFWAVNSTLVAVNSHWERNSHTGATAYVQGTNATFLNTSFVGNGSFGSGTINGRDGQLELVNTTFADNRDTYPSPNSNPDDVVFSGTGSVALYNVFSNRGAQSIFAPYTGAGNCLLDGADPYRETMASGATKVLLRRAFGCLNSGDDAAATRATEHAAAFAASLDATSPLGERWWRTSSSVLRVPSDKGRIDPGRHYRADE